MSLYDISRSVAPGIPVWPGDQEYQFHLGWKMSEGASVNVGAVTMSLHTGTHADAPFHFDPAGIDIGELPLTNYVGPAWVVDATGHSEIGLDVFVPLDLETAPRVLLKTGAWPAGTPFPEQVPTLAPEVPAYLADRGVCLVGVDVPSVDAIDSQELPVHRALYRGGIAILESLDLSAVPVGRYTLVAPPLRLYGADASPVRAVLLEESLRMSSSP